MSDTLIALLIILAMHGRTRRGAAIARRWLNDNAAA